MEEPVSLGGLEAFSLGYKVQWPLSIVISRKALAKYQLIFRFLLYCKHVNRRLCGAWQEHQKVERLKSLCLQYAAATQWLISSSIDIPKAEESTDSSLQFGKSKQGKLRNSSESRKLTTGNATITDSIL